MQDIIRVFIGHDSRTPNHTEVCRESILANTQSPVFIETLDMDALRRASLYRRWHYMNEDEVIVDGVDGRPFSSEFTFTRFLIPCLMQWKGYAIFCDSDFMFKGDIQEIWDTRDSRYAVRVAKQEYASRSSMKKNLVPQQNYPRKNWSSLILWNASHPAHHMLTSYMVNSSSGSWLHRFSWLDDLDIGGLDPRWNWIEGTTEGEPQAVHFTMGTPDIDMYRDSMHAAEWLRYEVKYRT